MAKKTTKKSVKSYFDNRKLMDSFSEQSCDFILDLETVSESDEELFGASCHQISVMINWLADVLHDKGLRRFDDPEEFMPACDEFRKNIIEQVLVVFANNELKAKEHKGD